MASDEQHSNLHVEDMEADDHIDAEHMVEELIVLSSNTRVWQSHELASSFTGSLRGKG